jgi:hypothetical protein
VKNVTKIQWVLVIKKMMLKRLKKNYFLKYQASKSAVSTAGGG